MLCQTMQSLFFLHNNRVFGHLSVLSIELVFMLLLLLPLFRFLFFLSGRNPKISLAPPYFKLSLLLFLFFLFCCFSSTMSCDCCWSYGHYYCCCCCCFEFWFCCGQSRFEFVDVSFCCCLFILFLFFFGKYFWLFTPHCLRFTPTYFNYLFVCFGGACACITTDNIPTNYFFLFWFMKRKIFNWFNLYWIIIWLDL